MIGAKSVTGDVIDILLPEFVSVRNPSIVAMFTSVSPEDILGEIEPVTIIVPLCMPVRTPMSHSSVLHETLVGEGDALTNESPAGSVSVIDTPEMLVDQLLI